jgi:hypothetical protein
MSRIYVRLLTVAAFVIALTGASFSIIGLSKLFAGAPISVAIMSGALEFAKLVVTGFLYRYWGHLHRPIRAYLAFAVVTLVFITSVGIYGFLSSAYQASSVGLKTQRMKIAALESQKQRIDGRVAEIQRFIESIPNSRISKKFELHKSYEPEIRRLQAESETTVGAIESEKTVFLKSHVEIGPAMFLADSIGVEIDTVVRWLILIFVLVFDPLAVCLVLCLNLAIRLREKYRGDEQKIGSYAIASPVDHRFKKNRDDAKPKRAA